jgi:hypothetical protein
MPDWIPVSAAKALFRRIRSPSPDLLPFLVLEIVAGQRASMGGLAL